MLLAKAEESETINLSYNVDAFRWGKTVEEVFANTGIILNAFDDAITEEINSNDHLSVIYTLFSSELKEKDGMTNRIHESVFSPISKELKGHAKFYVWDCDHPELPPLRQRGDKIMQFMMACGDHNQNRVPSFLLLRQPERKINPYTGEAMRKEMKQYSENGIDSRLFKKWVSDNLSDFTSKIYSKKDYDVLI